MLCVVGSLSLFSRPPIGSLLFCNRSCLLQLRNRMAFSWVSWEHRRRCAGLGDAQPPLMLVIASEQRPAADGGFSLPVTQA